MRITKRTIKNVAPTDVYCMTVPEHRNFAVSGTKSNRESRSAFAHNCDADPD